MLSKLFKKKTDTQQLLDIMGKRHDRLLKAWAREKSVRKKNYISGQMDMLDEIEEYLKKNS